MQKFILIILLFTSTTAISQSKIDSFRLYRDVKVTTDVPQLKYHHTIIILFALPNGNTTEQTMGKQLQPGDDWHFDIQHIKAQTEFIRRQLKENVIVVYLENSYKSWPTWKQRHAAYKLEIQQIVDTISNLFPVKNKTLYFNGHSGGGSFIFGYLDGIEAIPSFIERISFLDSNYGYDSSYYAKLKNWLKQNKQNTLSVFAYNDSVALYNNKPIVSATGGTWYRSHLMLHNLQNNFSLTQKRNDSLIVYENKNRQIAFFFKTNPERKIFHTQQVELNGFIHSILYRTKGENNGYEYFGPRAYISFIQR